MIFGSVCSGIEAASVAWNPLGWEAAWFCEISEFCSELLRIKYGDKNLGDATKAAERATPVDIVVGGTPCQSFSVQGRRGGLDDPRGQLALAFVRIVRSARPRWVIWENVQGVLASNQRRDFKAFVLELAQCGYGLAYRVLDCRYFGVAQRRRRVFLVGHSGGHCGPAIAALFEKGSLGSSAEASFAEWEARTAGTPRVIGFSGDETPKYAVRCLPTLRSGQGGEGIYVLTNRFARRITVTEMERAMGFEPGYTAIEYRGRPAPDSLRRFALGNSFPVPVVRWIGERIAFIDNLLR